MRGAYISDLPSLSSSLFTLGVKARRDMDEKSLEKGDKTPPKVDPFRDQRRKKHSQLLCPLMVSKSALKFSEQTSLAHRGSSLSLSWRVFEGEKPQEMKQYRKVKSIKNVAGQ